MPGWHELQAMNLDKTNHVTKQQWLLDILACPQDSSEIIPDANVLRCAACNHHYAVNNGIPSFYLSTAAEHQQRVYGRIESIGQGGLRFFRPFAHELATGFQHVYKTGLLEKTLLLLDKEPEEGETWIYTGGGEGVQCMILSGMGGEARILRCLHGAALDR